MLANLKWYGGVIIFLVVIFIIWIFIGHRKDMYEYNYSLRTPLEAAHGIANGTATADDAFPPSRPESNPYEFANKKLRNDTYRNTVRNRYSDYEEYPQSHSYPQHHQHYAQQQQHYPQQHYPQQHYPQQQQQHQQQQQQHYGMIPQSTSALSPGGRIAVKSPRLKAKNVAFVGDRPEVVSMMPRVPPQFEKMLSVEECTGRDKKVYQGFTRIAAERVFGVPFQEDVRTLPWMMNPVPGKNGKHSALELDIYNPDIGVAIEYNGIQHYVFPNWYHKFNMEDYTKFWQQRDRDKIKPDLCDRNGTYLIVVPFNIHRNGVEAIDDIEAWLRYMHPEAVQRRLMEQKEKQRIEVSNYMGVPDASYVQAKDAGENDYNHSTTEVTACDLLDEGDYI